MSRPAVLPARTGPTGRPRRRAAFGTGDRGEARLHRSPELLIDDAQLRDGLDDHFGLAVLPRHPAPSRRILDPAPAVPDQFADIEPFPQQARANPGMAADRALRPQTTTRTLSPSWLSWRAMAIGLCPPANSRKIR